jgi:hypothetical protein
LTLLLSCALALAGGAQVAAIGSYASGSIPAEFQTPGGACATIVIWTKLKVGDRQSGR